MNTKIEEKLKHLPNCPGVYFYRDAGGEIIYVGKAANLRKRVQSYFQKSRNHDIKTKALIADIESVDWLEVESEIDALFLEAEQIRRYMPKYNIMLRDDKSLVYIRISLSSQHPTVTTTRRPLDDGAEYFGPYFSALTIKKALRSLRRIFPYSTHINGVPKRACLQYHLGLCPGLETNQTSLEDYRANLRLLIQYLKGNRVSLVSQLETEMKQAASEQDFELAAKYRNQVLSLMNLKKQIVFSDSESLNLSNDQALSELAELLGISKIPRVIEGYDISHMQGTDNVASMVVFANGVPDKKSYRKFKMRIPGNDDFKHMNEVIKRRLKRKDQKSWKLPDLILIDGGKGQLSSAQQAAHELGISVPMIGLAKRQEEIIISSSSLVNLSSEFANRNGALIVQESDFTVVNLPHSSPIIKLLQRIRDESHRFAVSYHSTLKIKRQTSSLLDEVPGFGPLTKKKLLKTFGSLRGVKKASQEQLAVIVGSKKAAILTKYLEDNQ